MKNLLYVFTIVAIVFFCVWFSARAATSVFQTFQGGTGTSSPSGILYGDNGATTHVNTVSIGSGLTFSGGTLSASGGGSGSGNVATSSAETSGRIPFWTSTAGTPATLSGGSANFVWDNTNKRLGIGSTSPYAALSIDGNAGSFSTSLVPLSIKGVSGTTVNYLEILSNAGTQFFAVNNSGNTAASNGLSVSGSLGSGITQAQIRAQGSSNIGAFLDNQIIANPTNISFAYRLQNSASGLVYFNVSQLGNTAIGTSTSPAWLAVQAAGTGAYGDQNPLFDVASTTSTLYATSSVFRINANGNVGIGSTTPGSLLSIGNTGGINFTTATSSFATTGGVNITNGCYAIGGVCIGSGGGGSGTVTSVATDATLTGGTITTTGTLGLNLANGNSWTALQQFTLPGLALNVANTSWYGIGGSLLAYASSTNGDTVFGLFAGGDSATTTASLRGLTAIGYFALNGSGTGNGNTAVGYKALPLITGSASGNTVVGNQAMNNAAGMSTGGLNTVIGASAGTNLNGAAFANTVIGNSAQAGGSGSNNNISIGYNTGTVNMQASSNINIGGGVYPAKGSTSNQLNIGNLIYGTGVYGNGTVVTNVPTVSGSFGISSSSPAAELAIQAYAGSVYPNNLLFAIGSSTATYSTSTLAVVTNTGFVGVGTTSPWGLLSVNPNALVAGIPYFVVGSSTATNFIVDSNGNTGIASSSPWRTLDVNGTVGFKGLTTSAGTQSGVLCLSASNEVINDSVACLASARRFKEQIVALAATSSLAQIMQLQPSSYLYKPDFNGALQKDPNYSRVQVGLIADDVQKVNTAFTIVETASTTFEGKSYPAGTIKGIDYNAITATLVGAVQQVVNHQSQQDVEIAGLKVEVEQLRSDRSICLIN